MKSIILAGGNGSRLWPLSREEFPKQLLSLDNKESLLQKTFKRLLSFSNASEIVTITNIKHYKNIKLQLEHLSKDNVIICEPLCKNTAPAIACALEYFSQNFQLDDIVLIVPSDHLITDVENFNKTIEKSKVLAEQGYIVTFGVKPNYPETGYGYIKVSNEFLNGYIVDKFVEKPNIETAKKYLEDTNYYWNSGIFLGKISTFIEEFKKFVPEIYIQLQNLNLKNNTKIEYSIYENMPSISIDYAVMEKSKKVALVKLMSDWNDLGSWQSIFNVNKKDKDGNVLLGKGEIVIDNVKNSLIYSQKRLVAVSDLENIVLVETEDAIMACKISKSQNVKKIYEQLKQKHNNTTKLHKTIFESWGSYNCINSTNSYLVKTINVFPKHNLQSYSQYNIHLVVLEGSAIIIKDNNQYNISSGNSINIPANSNYSIQNPYDKELKIIEIQTIVNNFNN